MSIAIPEKNLNELIDEGLFYRCDACGDDSELFRQGECDGKLFHVSIDPGGKGDRPVIPRSDLAVDLCRLHTRLLQSYVTWGASFCSCGGIIERTGKTRPIDNSDGVWEETQCEYYDNHKASPVSPRYSQYPHYHEWEPVD